MAEVRGTLLAFAAVVVLFVSGCGGGDDGSTNAATGQEKVTLSLLYNNHSQKAMETTIAEFEKANPNIKIRAEFIDGGALIERMLPQLQAGHPPDLFQTQPGNFTPISPWALAKAGHLLDLSNEEWTSNRHEPTAKWSEYEGKTYARPVVLGPHGVAYNKKLFSELGLQIPTTFDELLAMCPKITAAGKTPISNGFAASLTSGIVMGQLLSANFVYGVEPDFDDKRTANQVTFAQSKPWQDLVNGVKRMKDDKCFGKAPQGTTIDAAFSAFAREKAAMTILSFSQIGGVTAVNPALDYGVFAFPAVQAEDTVVSAVNSQALSASAKTKHPEAARAFIAYIAREESAKRFAEEGGGVAITDAAAGKLPEFASAMEEKFAAGKVIDGNHVWPNPVLLVGESGLAGGITAIMTGQKTPEQVLEDLDYLWENPKATAAD
jgi:raffinose/stachyose/melibiose transport system substrate-binding protein